MNDWEYALSLIYQWCVNIAFIFLSLPNSQMVNGIPLTNREGSNVDEERLLCTFDLLGFKNVKVRNPKSEEIIPKIRESLIQFCSEAKKNKLERCFAISILAHGDKGTNCVLNFYCTSCISFSNILVYLFFSDGFYCSNGNLVTWDSIRAELRHPDTNGLARLLLIQACKGLSQGTLATF